MTDDDPELIRLYVETRSEAAFAELVRRYISLVYHAALRQVAGDTHRAEDVTQSVFSLLARKASSLRAHPSLAGWLHTTTRFAAREALRSERRRLIREQEAHTMHELSHDPTAANDWERVRPVIDEALGDLNERDREAVLLRFFTGLPLAEIGAQLDVTENTARMRVDRALEKLHALLAKRGVTSTTAALALALAHQTAAAVPAGLAAAVTGSALAGAATAGGGILAGLKFLSFMSTTKITLGVAAAVAIAATAITFQQQKTNVELRDEIAALRQQSATTTTLREENQRLVAEKVHDADAARAEHDELLQLRAARDAFRKRLAAGAAPTARPPQTDATKAPASSKAMVPVDAAARDSGQATPADTARTLLWCLQGGDVTRAAELLAFEPAEKERLQAFINTLPEKIRAEYDTPEKLIAFVISGSPKPLAGVQLLSESQPDPNTTVQQVRLEYQSGEMREDQIKFQRGTDGWKQVVSPSTVDRVIAYFKAKQ